MKTKTYSPLNWLSLLGLIAILFCCSSAWAGVNPTITWPAPAPISYGTPLGPTQLNATANALGTFTYNPPAGTVLHANPSVLLSVTFVPTDTATYNTVTVSVNLTVNPATLVASAAATSNTYGQPNPTFTGTVTGMYGITSPGPAASFTDFNNGVVITFGVASGVGPGSDVGFYTISPQIQDPLGNSGDYSIQFNNALLTINKAHLQFQPNNVTVTYGNPVPNFGLNGIGSRGTVTLVGLYNNGKTGSDLHDDIYAVAKLIVPSGQLNDGTISVTPGGYQIVLAKDAEALNTGGVNGLAIYGNDVANGRLQKNYTFDAQVKDGALNGADIFTGNLNVTAKTVTLTALTQSINYGTDPGDPNLLPFNGSGADQILATDFEGNSNASGIAGSIRLGYQSSGVTPGTYTLLPAVKEAPASSHRANNYIFQFIGASLTINQLDVQNLITWNPQNPITYGTRLGSSVLNATVSLPANKSLNFPDGFPWGAVGTAVYTPPAGTFMSVGNNQTLSVTFTPNQLYKQANAKTVQINVIPATPVINWGGNSSPTGVGRLTAIPYGTYLGANQLNAVVSGVNDPAATQPPAATYLPPAGTLLKLGNDQVLTAFVPQQGNYNSAVGTVKINITKGSSGWVNLNNISVPKDNLTVPVIQGKIMVNQAPALGTVSVRINTKSDGSGSSIINSNLTFSIQGDGTLISPSADPGFSIATLKTNTDGTLAFDQTKTYYIRYVYGDYVDGSAPNSSDAEIGGSTAVVQLTFGRVSPTFDSLVGANIPYGYWTTNSITLKGHLNSGAVAMGPGRNVDIAVNGTHFTAAIGSDNKFSYALSQAQLEALNLNVIQSPYVVTYSWAGDSSFADVTDTSQIIVVTKIPLTVTPSAVSQQYYSPLPTFVGVGANNGLAGLIPADVSVLSATYHTIAATNSSGFVTENVGQFSILPDVTVASGQDATIKLGNYSLTRNSALLTVTNRPLYVVAVPLVVPTNAPLPTLTVQYLAAANNPDDGTYVGTSGFVAGDTASVIVPPVTITATNASGQPPLAGREDTYTIVPSGGASVNYALKYVTGILRVTGAGAIINWGPLASIAYGTPLGPSLNAYATVGNPPVRNDDKLPITYTSSDWVGAKKASDLAGTILPVGAHSITATCTPDAATYPILGPSSLTLNLTVNKASLVIKMRNATRKFGADNSTAVDPASTSTPVSFLPGGWVVTPDTQGYLGFVPGDDKNNSLDFLPVAQFVDINGALVTTSTPKGTGYFVSVVAIPTSSKYTVSITPGQLSITGIDPSFTWNPAQTTIAANNGNAEALNGVFTMMYGEALGDAQLNASANTAGKFTYNPPKGTVLPAGKNTLSATFVPDSGSYNNKTITTDIQVAKSPLVVEFPLTYWKSANNVGLFSRIYGDPNPTIDQTKVNFWPLTNSAGGGAVIGSFQNNDTRNSLGLNIVYWDTTSNVVVSTSTYAQDVDDIRVRGNTGNYSIRYVTVSNTPPQTIQSGTPLSFKIVQAPMQVKTANLSRPFGSPNPDFNAAITLVGIKPIDVGKIGKVGTCPAKQFDPPGSYFITPNLVADSSLLLNYVITGLDQPGTLTVIPAPLTVAVKNKTIAIGKPIPTWSSSDFSIYGFVGTDTVQTAVQTLPTFATTATSSSGLGTYPVIVTTAGVANNYAFYSAATPPVLLTVGAQAATLTIGTPVAPIARPVSFARVEGQVLKMLIQKITATCTDPNGGVVSLFAFDPITSNGAQVTSDGFWLYYQAPPGFNTNDVFTYTIANDAGLKASSTVTVTVKPNPATAIPKNNVAPVVNADGTLTVRFVGVQGWKYKVQGTDTFPAVNWQDLVVNQLTVDFNNDNNPPPANNINSQTGKATWAGLTGNPGDANRVPNGSVLCGPAFVIYKDLDSVLFPSRFYRCIFFSQ